MTDTSAEGNVEALSEDSTEMKAPSLDDFASPKIESDKEDVAEDEKHEDQEEDESEGIEQPEDEEDPEDGEVLSQEIDLEQIGDEEKTGYLDSIYASLDDEARREWLSNRDGRIGKDMGKMRQKAADAESRADAAEAKYQELQSKTFYSDNPYSSVLDREKLDESERSVNASIAEARKFLRSNEDYYVDVNGKEFDREAVDNWLDALLKNKDAIPAQRERIRSIEKSKERSKAAEDKLKETYDWMSDESGETYEAYKKLRNDPKWSMVSDLIPDLAAELPKVLAKFVDGGATSSPAAKKKLPIRGKRKPKGDYGSAGGGRRKSKAKVESKKKLFSGSASEADELAMFT